MTELSSWAESLQLGGQEKGRVLETGAVMRVGDSGFISRALEIPRQPVLRAGSWIFEHSL